MTQDFLSDVELYYSEAPVTNGEIQISGDEFHHINDVMRHQAGDRIYVTDGHGVIYLAEIKYSEKKKTVLEIKDSKNYRNKFQLIWFCIPRLKSADRFEFALEKCIELGITNFIVFDSKRSVAKGEKIDRWEKIAVAAMKQSLRSWKPQIKFVKTLSEIYSFEGEKILFDQKGERTLQQYITQNGAIFNGRKYFIFGPEGGLADEELGNPDAIKLRLTENRLRSETAVVSAAAVLANNFSE